MDMNKIKELKGKVDSSEVIVIGAGAGLSTSAGYIYTGERFNKYFRDFIDKYGFTDMYSGGFYHFETMEEYWAYWSRYIYINRYTNPPKPVYSNLLKLVEDKNYFVITTNVDHIFQKSGFDKKRLFYTQGDYGLFQCSEPCHKQTYDNEYIITKMVNEQENMKVPSNLIPLCPKCNKPMTMNLRADMNFVEDDGWHNAARNYQNFLNNNKDKKVLFLELGVGYNTPSIIKYPFWQMTNNFKDAFYVCINERDSAFPKEIEDKSIGIDDDIGEVLEELLFIK